MATFLMPPARQRGWSNSGVPAANCLLYTYEAGTTNPKAAYTDAAGTIPHTNPIVLDAKGEALIYWDGNYRIDLKTAAGVQVTGYPVDNFETPLMAASLSGGAGGGLIGFQYATVYPINTVGRWLKDLALSTGSTFIGFIQAGAGAVLRTLQSKSRDTVSAFDFMTTALIDDAKLATPTLDHTAAVQAAIDYCIANNRDLEVPGLCRITAPLMVDRQVDGAAFDSYFTIQSSSGGGFYVDSAINMFSSTIVDAVSPGSQLIRWRGLRFVASSNALAAYVIEGTKFLRCELVGCNFSKIKFLLSAKYIQSIYLINCNARRWAGTFFKASPQAYDIQVIGGLYESSSGSCIDFSSPIGCKFWTQIEGMAGTALLLNGCQGVDISLYAEANGLDFDCRTGGLSNFGINLHGSYFSHADATYSVKWGVCSGCTSIGNWHTNNMHDLQSDSMVEINDKAQTNLSNADAAFNIGYREGVTAALDIRGAGSAAYTVSGLTSRYTRQGARMQIEFICTLTSTAVNAADALYIPSTFPINAATPGMLCGHVEVSGSSVNNGIAPLYISSAVPLRVQTPINVIPANVATDSWTVRGQISYQVAT